MRSYPVRPNLLGGSLYAEKEQKTACPLAGYERNIKVYRTYKQKQK